MAEDMSDIIKQVSQMLNNDTIPDNLKDIMNNLSNNSNDDISSNQTQSNNQTESNDDTSQGESSNGFDIDIGTILKMKTVMESLNSNDDPRSNLLMSLKPYLKDSRKQKVDQYSKLLGMTKMFELFNKDGGK